MDFQIFVDTFSSACAVLSVKKGFSGHAGEIRIHRANGIYRRCMGLEHFHNDTLYGELIPPDDKFEDFCYRCAVEKQSFHYYIKVPGLPMWSEINLLPLEADEGGLFYCAFLFKSSEYAESEKMADISPEMSAAVLKNSMVLRGSKDFMHSLEIVVDDLKEKTDGSACRIILIDRKKQTFSIVPTIGAETRERVRAIRDYMNYALVSGWEATLGESDCIIIKDGYDMAALEKKNPLWVESLKAASIKSLIFYPLVQGKEVFGYLFITNFDTKNLVKLKELVSLTAFFLSSEVATHTLVERLEKMGREDLLTGVKNRNAMNFRVDTFGESDFCGRQFGVVFADLNGLKQINDEKGHGAGDELIKSAAECIKSIFTADEIYRAGGDEFVIICFGCKKSDFERKTARLKGKTCYGEKVLLAIGSAWCDDGKDLRKAMHLADEAMYRDKSEFYKAHQEIDRRSCR